MLSFSKTYNPVVYLSAEFAIDSELPTYAGGLGVLAGDVIKQAADEDFQMIGIGILYRGKHFVQHITGEGKEEKRDSQFDHDASFLRPTTGRDGKPINIIIDISDERIVVKAYHIRLSDNTIQFFLSTDVDGNPNRWRNDMNALYSGDSESQIRQQIILGIGGYKLVQALGVNVKKYHFNEGRPIFLFWELLAKYTDEGKSCEEAFQMARSQVSYTNHTLVDAANLEYTIDQVTPYAASYADRCHVPLETILEPGKTDHNTFSITKFALEVSSKHSAVSKLHYELAKKHWPNVEWVGITNGIHMPSWQDSDFRKPNLTDKQLWDLHMEKKMELERSVIERTGFGYDYNRLTITWARRLAEYKQPMALFADIQRLQRIVSKEGREMQILFAGNAHGPDQRIKGIIEEIIKIASSDLHGHVIFIPNYNTSLANHLVSGSDIWLNTPKYGLEASGTSGMKAMSNGCINATVADGWAHEVEWKDLGWELHSENISEQIYALLEGEIANEYYERNDDGIPTKWITRMRKSLAEAERFSTERVLKEYNEKLY